MKVSVVFKDNKDILEPFSAILKSRRSLCNSLFSTNKGEINREFSVNYQSLLTKEQIIIIKACTPIICIAAKPGKPIPKPIATPTTLLFSPTIDYVKANSYCNNFFWERTELFAQVGSKTLQHFKAQVMPEIENIVRKSLHSALLLPTALHWAFSAIRSCTGFGCGDWRVATNRRMLF